MGVRVMENNDFDKRMELLKKSYDRIPSSFNSEEVLRKIDIETNKPESEKSLNKKMNSYSQRIAVWAVSIASVFMIGFLSATFILPDKEEQGIGVDKAITEQFLLQLEESYKEERDKRQEMLKMEDDKFIGLSFIRLSDDRMNFLLNNEFADRLGITTQKDMEEEYEKVIKGLELPSDMVVRLLENPLTDDESGSIAFLSEYRNKVNALITVYNDALLTNQEKLDEGKGSESTRKLLNMREGMEKQNIKFLENEYMEFVTASYERPENYSDIYDSLHVNVRGYYDMLIDEPYMQVAWLKDPPYISADYVLNLQSTLVNVKRDSTLYPKMYSYYSSLFFDLVKGSEYTRILGEDGVVKPEYQQVWKRFSSGLSSVPTVYFMKPIVDEMEASGWRSSKSWDAFDWNKIEEAMDLAREGKLE
jgi:hypothetical protein